MSNPIKLPLKVYLLVKLLGAVPSIVGVSVLVPSG